MDYHVCSPFTNALKVHAGAAEIRDMKSLEALFGAPIRKLQTRMNCGITWHTMRSATR